MNLAQFGNFYLDRNQPWKLIKEDRERCATVLHICLKLVQALAVLMTPYLPFSSHIIWKTIGNKNSIKSWNDALSELKEGTPLEKPAPLFKKLTLEEIISDPFSRIDLRAAKIMDVEDHPNADRLYILEIDVGQLGKRKIVAGIKPDYKKEELLGKSIVIVANLKPATIRGIESKGMLLAAQDKEGISLLDPRSPPGSEIYVEEIPRDPAVEIENLEVEMYIKDKKVLYKRKPLKSEGNTIVTDKEVEEGAKVR
jgi:methionyl-tRNA synthetase